MTAKEKPTPAPRSRRYTVALGDCYVPVALRPLAKRLESLTELTPSERAAVLFLVRLGDELHRAFYATFLTRSGIHQLRDDLGVPDLDVEIEVFQLKWTYRQGLVAATSHIAFDYDMYAVNVLTKIGMGVSSGAITARQGLRLIRSFETDPPFSPWGAWYRDFPGRGLVIPLMSATCATVYFEGTWYDLGFAALNGAVAALIAWLSTVSNDFVQMADYAVSLVVAMLAVMSTVVVPQGTCFGAQVLGTLYWFLYGTAFVLSIYEVTNNQLLTGLTRFVAAVVRSYGLAVGTVLGVWIAAYGGEDRFDRIVDNCAEKEGQIADIWFILLFPLSGIACLMQFRVGLRHYPVCLFVQTVAYGLQYYLGTYLKLQDFIANLVPAFAATLASHVCVEAVHYIQLRRFGPEASLSEEADTVFLPPFQKLASKKKDDDAGEEKTNDVGVEKAAADHPPSDGDDDDDDDDDSAKRDKSTATGEGGVDESLHVEFDNTNWAENSRGVRTGTGYIPTDKLAYQRTDLWFCLLPALYLLVPGSKLLQTVFYELMTALGYREDDTTTELQNFAGGLFIIALGQVIGLRFGFATIWVVDSIWERISCRSRE